MIGVARFCESDKDSLLVDSDSLASLSLRVSDFLLTRTRLVVAAASRNGWLSGKLMHQIEWLRRRARYFLFSNFVGGGGNFAAEDGMRDASRVMRPAHASRRQFRSKAANHSWCRRRPVAEDQQWRRHQNIKLRLTTDDRRLTTAARRARKLSPSSRGPNRGEGPQNGVFLRPFQHPAGQHEAVKVASVFVLLLCVSSGRPKVNPFREKTHNKC